MHSKEVSEREAGRLLSLAFPALPLVSTRRLAAGWDNTAFLVDNQWVFRFPRHALAGALLRREVELLAVIAPRLPAPVPDYAYRSGPVLDFPYDFAGYRLLPGRPLSEVPEPRIELIAEPLAHFLTELHGVPDTLVPPAIPRWTPMTWLERHDRLVETTLPAVATRDEALAEAVGAWWAKYYSDPRAVAFEPCLIHGDLAAEHMLVDSQGRFCGVIDFGDAMVADPALDLAGLPDALFQAVLRRLSPEDEGIAARRLAFRRLAPLHGVEASSSLGRPELLAAGIDLLRQNFDRDGR